MAARTRRLKLVGRHNITIDGQTISYTIKRSYRINYARLEVKLQTGVTVVIPRAFDIGHIPSLLRAKRCWILAKLAKYSQVKPLSVPAKLNIGDTIPYLGRDLELVVHKDQSADSVKLLHNRLLVSLKSIHDGSLALALEWWYRTQGVQIIKKRAEELSPLLQVSYNRLSIRGQKTRWGSCSQRGNLSFNWKLIMAPEPVIDYVIIHELAHLKEMNHSKRFWKLVAEICPRWREHRRWLKEHEASLAAKLKA